MRQLSVSAAVLFTLAAATAPAQTNPQAPIRILGQELGDALGFSLAPAGDVDGDGDADLLVGAPSSDANQQFAGRAYLFEGPFAGALPTTAAANTISTTVFGDNVGGSVSSAGDVNGDGLDDILVGARGNDAGGIQAGRAYLFLGPVTERLAAGADAVITGLPFEEIGRIVARAGDLDNDGFDDIIVGSDIAGPARQGRLYIFKGPVSGPLSVANASAVLTGAVTDDFFGTSVAAPGDLNGDGFADLVVGASRLVALGDTNGPGRVYVFHGPFSGGIGAASAHAVLTGELLNDAFGQSVATGDVNGDGTTDLVVGAHQLFRTDGTGKAYVFHGPLAGAVPAASAQAIIRGEGLGNLLGGAVATGDLDQDGDSDVVVGAPGFTGQRVYVYRAPFGGSVPAASAAFVASGAPNADFGKSVATADLNGDGRPDVIASGPAASDDTAATYVAVFTNALPPLPVRKQKAPR
ncbi:MAG: FG-GAP-like repeat-containing protein [Vicinamibacteria bacterium]